MLKIIQGDCLTVLRTLPDESVNCCVTSPPYWGLRDYGVAGQIGLERTPEEYVAKMVEVFVEVRRVLRGNGTAWVNLGDCYNAYNGGSGPGSKIDHPLNERNGQKPKVESGFGLRFKGLKPKDLVGVPWRVAFALQADGWYLRSDVIWHKPNPMPESVTDRPTKAHEYIFLLTKSERYAYDAEAIKEDANEENFRDSACARRNPPPGMTSDAGFQNGRYYSTRNRRTVWTVPIAPYDGCHFATFPPDLIKPCILAGCPVGGTVLDPFGGSGTTGQVALELGRKAILIELNPAYVDLIRQRTNVTPGLPLA